MSGVASKLTRLQRSRSLTGVWPPLLDSPEVKYNSMRGLHGSILNPRAPKIRHLNASHTLLIDLDKHIAKVQELELKVYELEMQLQMRETQKLVQESTPSLPQLPSQRATSLITEEERIAFQNRLVEAKRRAEELSRKTTQEEANILRSWHSKRLKGVLEDLSCPVNTEKSLKLLAVPSEVEEQENRIFNALNAIVDVANVDELSTDDHIGHLKELILERENLKNYLEDVRYKLTKSKETLSECQASVENLLHSSTALNLELQASNYYLCSLLRPVNSNNSIWIYGPNPIFAGARATEISASFENYFVQEMVQKMEVSQINAENNLAFAQNLVKKYSRRVEQGTKSLQEIDNAIEAQVQVITKDREEYLEILNNVCSRAQTTKKEEVPAPSVVTRAED